MRRIAVYGKGGIGKSTMCANLSVALARLGHKVVQIGCDPKHDSTRLLLHGKKLNTVLDYMRVTKPTDYRLSQILEEGYLGIGCVEAGGPKPGVGCAGRGIISTFELLEQFKLEDRYDTTVYDVLGDVVCGGFAVPIRSEYADTILVVTSGEFMALYAANNILRGIHNYDGDRKRVAGLIYNRRNVEGEDERVQVFAEAVGLPVFATIPRSDAFTIAEKRQMTAMEDGSSQEVCAVFERMARALDAGCELHEARPLSDEELERAVLGIEVLDFAPEGEPCDGDEKDSTPGAGGIAQGAGPNAASHPVSAQASPSSAAQGDAPGDSIAHKRYLSRNVVFNEPLYGCAFNGAMCTAINLRDAVVLAHSPKSCAYISLQTITSPGRRLLFERGSLLPTSLAPNLFCTEMDEPQIVFGGTDALLAKVEELKGAKPSAIVVISACPAGIIGDDTGKVEELSTPQTPVIALRTDGNMTGDYQQGMFMAYTTLARKLIRKDAPRKPRTVNVIAEKPVVTNTQRNFDVIKGFLSRMGVKVGCRFLYDTSVEALEGFCSAGLTLMAYGDYTATTLASFLHDEFGAEVFERAFPIGYDETCAWLNDIGARFGAQGEARAIIEEQERKYEAAVRSLRPALEGKRLMVITYNAELDWILKTAIDAGMQIAKIGVLDYSQDIGFRSRLGIELPVELHYDRADREADIKLHKPDVLLTNYASSLGGLVPVADTIPMCPDVGFGSGLRLAERWAGLLKLNLKGRWREDEQLFKQYYS